jgi:hypothetical protein
MCNADCNACAALLCAIQVRKTSTTAAETPQNWYDARPMRAKAPTDIPGLCVAARYLCALPCGSALRVTAELW